MSRTPLDVKCSKGRATRRQFVSALLAGSTVACSDSKDGPTTKSATDRVPLGSTGIQLSRLAMGTGTRGTAGASDQTRLGLSALSTLLVDGYDRGLNFFDSADDYGSHSHVAAAMKQIGRKNVVLLTKTMAQTAAAMQADLDRFRSELGTDMLDIVLLHGKTSATWASECAGAMEVLEKAKQMGVIRAHGISCHSIEALRLAAATPWVDVDLARVNPMGIRMDADPSTVIEVLRQMKASGKGVIGMKILGEGKLANNLDMAIGHAVNLDAIDAFSIGFTSQVQLDQVMQKVVEVQSAA
jgi:predicted aldo/keto reductase-like oxidoreductase